MKLRDRLATGLLGLLVVTPADAGDFLGDLTWPQARQRLAETPAVVIPFGAGAKQHGPHLPMNTDQRVMQHLLEHAATHHDVVIAPPVLHGWFPAFSDYPGTEIADASVFQNYIAAIAESLVKQRVQRLVFLNLGITRATGLPLAVVARDMRSRHGIPTLVLSWDDLETDAVGAFSEQTRGGHADELETSVMLALDPQAVAMDKAAVDYRGALKSQIGYAPGHFEVDPDNPASGVFGDARLASAEKGTKVLQIMRERLTTALAQFTQEQ